MRSFRFPLVPILGSLFVVSACSKPAPPPAEVAPPPAAVAPTPPPPAAPAEEEVPVYSYSPQEAGDWHRSYRQWEPKVVFEVGGRYYQHQVPNARSIQVYQYKNRYFMPPRDKGWDGTDRRLDPKSRPSDEDYRRARPRP